MTSESARNGVLSRERLLFGILLLIQTSLYAWLILGRRLMRPHDALFEYQLQYVFLAHACQSSDLALWLPYSLHGVTTNWFANFQGGVFQNILLFLGGAPEGTNMLPLFHLGMFLDEFILLLGTWSLSRRFYAGPYTRFFVTAAVLGSTFWATDFNFGLKIYYGVPLLLSLIHQFLEDGKRWPLFLAANFSALQFSGSISYLPGLIMVVVLTYFLVHALIFRTAWADRFRTLRPRPVDALILLVNGGVLVAIYAAISNGASEIRLYRPGRESDASVTLDSFLTYAGTLDPGRYADFFLGATPSMDYSLYCGACVPFLALVGLLGRPGKKVLHLVICLLLILFFSMGFLSLIPAVAYEFIPPLRYFRYVSLAAPLVKLFLILLAGYGFEALIAGGLWRTRMMKGLLASILLVLVGISWVLILAMGSAEIRSVLRAQISGLAGRPENLAAIPVAITGVFTLIFGGFLLLANRGSVRSNACMVFLVVLETVDVFRWKTNLFREETVALDDSQYALQEIRPLPFIDRRSADRDASERYRTLHSVLSGYGAEYDLADTFCHLDPPTSHLLLHYWMTPFDRLIRASNREPLDGKVERPPRFRSDFSSDSLNQGDPYSKIIGRTAGKIQVFRKAHVAESDPALVDILNHPRFQGDLLLLSPGPENPASSEPLTPDLLSANERLDVQPRILQFDMNMLSLKVELPPALEGAWLSYSDVWNPGWTAMVNGKAVPVERAFLAYKAVKLEPGANVVTFRFQAPIRAWAYRLVGLSSLYCIASFIFLTFRILKDPPRETP